MPQITPIDPRENEPEFGSGQDVWPAGWHPVRIVKQEWKAVQGKPNNSYIQATIVGEQGSAVAGRENVLRWNVQNDNAQAVVRAKKEITAIAAVLGIFSPITDTDILNNRPFMIECLVTDRKYTDNNGAEKTAQQNEFAKSADGIRTLQGITAKDAWGATFGGQRNNSAPGAAPPPPPPPGAAPPPPPPPQGFGAPPAPPQGFAPPPGAPPAPPQGFGPPGAPPPPPGAQQFAAPPPAGQPPQWSPGGAAPPPPQWAPR